MHVQIAKELWDALKDSFSHMAKTKILQLQLQLQSNSKLQDVKQRDTGIVAFCNRIQSIVMN